MKEAVPVIDGQINVHYRPDLPLFHDRLSNNAIGGAPRGGGRVKTRAEIGFLFHENQMKVNKLIFLEWFNVYWGLVSTTTTRKKHFTVLVASVNES